MRVPRDTVTACLVLAVCLAALAFEHDQPLVRNSLVYARTAEHIIAHGFDPLPIVADSRLSYDKPIAFAWTAAPLVRWFGNHLGLMLASALGVMALLAATLHLVRTMAPGAANERLRARAVLFGSLSPLVVYQTWSAHPDAIEAALQLVAFTLAWRLANEPSRAPWRNAVLLFAALEAGVLFKNYGLVMLAVLPLALGRRFVRAAREGGRSAVLGAACAWLAVALLALLAWFELHPLHRLVGEGGGAEQYGRGALLDSATGTGLALLLALGLCVQTALPFAARCRPGTHQLWPLLGFAAVHTAGLMPFPHAYYNQRYFLPVLPIVGVCAAFGLERSSPRTARSVTAAFVAIALATIALFHIEPLHAAAQPWLPEWRLRGERMPGMLDNLRLPQHTERREWLQRLNTAAPPGSIVYLIDFDYYGDAQHGVYERAGQIRRDIITRYVARRALQPTEPTFFACFGRQPDRAGLAKFGEVDEPQPGVFRVRRR